MLRFVESRKTLLELLEDPLDWCLAGVTEPVALFPYACVRYLTRLPTAGLPRLQAEAGVAMRVPLACWTGRSAGGGCARDKHSYRQGRLLLLRCILTHGSGRRSAGAAEHLTGLATSTRSYIREELWQQTVLDSLVGCREMICWVSL